MLIILKVSKFDFYQFIFWTVANPIICATGDGKNVNFYLSILSCLFQCYFHNFFSWMFSLHNKLIWNDIWWQCWRCLQTSDLGHSFIIFPALNLYPLWINLGILFASWSLLCTEQMFSWSGLQWQQDIFLNNCS